MLIVLNEKNGIYLYERQHDSGRYIKKTVIYARVSSSKQKNDGNLKRQVQRLELYAKENGYEIVKVFQEQDSGINENRKQLQKLIHMAEKKELDVLLIEYPDRLALFGYLYLEQLFRICGAEIISTQKKEPRSSQEELTENLLTIITVFSARMYGKRSPLFRQQVQKSMEEMGGEQNGVKCEDTEIGDSSEHQ